MVLLLFYFKVHTTVSSSTVSREKSRFSPFTIPTVSLYEKYGVFEKNILLVKRYCRNSTKGKI